MTENVADVYARWSGRVWQYIYTAPCPHCGRIHMHGGGNGDVPDLAIGETGNWTRHCLDSHLSEDSGVTLRLVRTEPKAPEPVPDGLTPEERGKAASRRWREANFFPCHVCPPHASGELAKHRTRSYHDLKLLPCSICKPLPSGRPRSHYVRRRRPRRAVRHVI